VSLADLISSGARRYRASREKGGTTLDGFPSRRAHRTPSQDQTNVDPLPISNRAPDGFRNYPQGSVQRIAEELLIDKAQLLT